MKIYRMRSGIRIDDNGQHYNLPVSDWDHFINDDKLFQKLTDFLKTGKATKANGFHEEDILAPWPARSYGPAGLLIYEVNRAGRKNQNQQEVLIFMPKCMKQKDRKYFLNQPLIGLLVIWQSEYPERLNLGCT